MEGWGGDTWVCSGGSSGGIASTSKPKVKDPIETAHDSTLILELIARGYAVWKPPVGE